MRSKTLILLVLALGCGLVASIGISQMLQRQDQGNPGDTSPVWVVKADIKQNDPLSMQNLKLEAWPKDKIPPGALSKIEDIEGKRARINLFAGDVVLDKKLVSKEEMALSYNIPDGYRITTVTADANNSFGGLLHPGDRVDVLLVMQNSTPGILRTGTKTILQDISVFAVDAQVRTTEDNAKEALPAKVVTLLVTPKQAQMLALANTVGKISLVMRSPTDKGLSDPEGVATNDLFGTEKGDRSAENMDKLPANPKTGLLGMLQSMQKSPATTGTAAPEPEQPPPSETFVMQMIRGDEISETDFRRKIDDPTRWDNGSSTVISAGSQSSPEGSPSEAAPAPAPTAIKSNNKPQNTSSSKPADATPAPAASGTGHS